MCVSYYPGLFFFFGDDSKDLFGNTILVVCIGRTGLMCCFGRCWDRSESLLPYSLWCWYGLYAAIHIAASAFRGFVFVFVLNQLISRYMQPVGLWQRQHAAAPHKQGDNSLFPRYMSRHGQGDPDIQGQRTGGWRSVGRSVGRPAGRERERERERERDLFLRGGRQEVAWRGKDSLHASTPYRRRMRIRVVR